MIDNPDAIKCGICDEIAPATECLFDPELNIPTCPDCTQAGIVAKIEMKNAGICNCTTHHHD